MLSFYQRPGEVIHVDAVIAHSVLNLLPNVKLSWEVMHPDNLLQYLYYAGLAASLWKGSNYLAEDYM